MLLCSLKCAPTQVKREIKLLTLTTKLFKIMEMEKFYVAPEVEVLEVEVEKGFIGSGWGDGDQTEPTPSPWE